MLQPPEHSLLSDRKEKLSLCWNRKIFYSFKQNTILFLLEYRKMCVLSVKIHTISVFQQKEYCALFERIEYFSVPIQTKLSILSDRRECSGGCNIVSWYRRVPLLLWGGVDWMLGPKGNLSNLQESHLEGSFKKGVRFLNKGIRFLKKGTRFFKEGI